MFKCEIIRPSEISERDIDVWLSFQSQTEDFKSPILSPYFSQEIEKVRDDVFLAIIRQDNEAVAFLPFHRRPNNFARPAGAPFSDYTALITAPNPNIKMADVLEMAEIEKFKAIGLLDPYNICEVEDPEIDDSYGIDFCNGGPPNKTGKKQRKNVNRLKRHVEEKVGTPVGFIFDDRDRVHFERMLELKSNQTKVSGIHDFLSPEWVKNFMDNLFNKPREGLYGSMITLTAGSTPISFHFGLKLNNRMHPWIATFDPKYFSLSPGQIFLMDCPSVLKENNIEYYDLSTGHSHYKSTFTNTHKNVVHGKILCSTLKAKAKASNKHEGKIGDIMARLNRRFDQIASLELDPISRTKGVAYAIMNAAKRVNPKNSD